MGQQYNNQPGQQYNNPQAQQQFNNQPGQQYNNPQAQQQFNNQPGQQQNNNQQRGNGQGNNAQGKACPPNSPIKGNINKKKEKIYHVPNSPSYNDVRPEQCFPSEQAARQAGFVAPR
ncbi:MAG: hypothetical protein NVS4B8_07470 [Herpetosiphon sp.]